MSRIGCKTNVIGWRRYTPGCRTSRIGCINTVEKSAGQAAG